MQSKYYDSYATFCKGLDLHGMQVHRKQHIIYCVFITFKSALKDVMEK